MNGFVDACRREWKRIGVPDAVANEMAADLEADLAEAEADGVSPEEVLGNGVFDAPSFAASWAAARGRGHHGTDRRVGSVDGPWVAGRRRRGVAPAHGRRRGPARTDPAGVRGGGRHPSLHRGAHPGGARRAPARRSSDRACSPIR